MSGQCYACGDPSLVFFLSRAIPALGIGAGTAFFFWSGMFTLSRLITALSSGLHRTAAVVLVPCSFVGQQVAGHGPVLGYSELLQNPMLRALGRTALYHRTYCLRFTRNSGTRFALWLAQISSH